MLSTHNSHPLDESITFDEGPHIYTVKGNSNYLSVTTFIHKQFQGFDADKIIHNMMNSENWSSSKYFGMTPEEIKSLWKNNGIEAAKAGTKMHYDIEQVYNNKKVNNVSPEFKLFEVFKTDHKDLIPYRTEWMIYDESLQLAGSIDIVFKNPDGTYSIYDWKRCKQIYTFNRFNKFSKTPCISHIPDINFWHYTLQLNCYKMILEKNYSITIRDMYIICLHPNQKKYKKIKLPEVKNEMTNLFELRQEQLKNICYL